MINARVRRHMNCFGNYIFRDKIYDVQGDKNKVRKELNLEFYKFVGCTVPVVFRCGVIVDDD